MNNQNQRAWPSNVDGDVFRRLDANEFDFTKEVEVDFNIDVDTWPPSPGLMNVLETRFSNVEVYVPDQSGDGYVQITLRALLTYDLAMSTQASLTSLAAPYGGICESWGGTPRLMTERVLWVGIGQSGAPLDFQPGNLLSWHARPALAKSSRSNADNLADLPIWTTR